MIKSFLILSLLICSLLQNAMTKKSCSVYIYQNNPGDNIINQEKGVIVTWEKFAYAQYAPFQNEHMSFNLVKYVVPIDEDCADCKGVGAGYNIRRPKESRTEYLNLIPGKIQRFGRCMPSFHINCPWGFTGEA